MIKNMSSYNSLVRAPTHSLAKSLTIAEITPPDLISV